MKQYHTSKLPVARYIWTKMQISNPACSRNKNIAKISTTAS